MIDFRVFLNEAKNTHMEHLEDLLFNEGVNGVRRSIFFLRDLRDMLAGNTKQSVSRTTKWDGAPAVFAGVDPRDGQFFVAKKGVFNKDPKVYKTPADVKADTSGDLQRKLLIALEEFSKLGIKEGVYQGDLMFTEGDVKIEDINGEKYYTFQPNTIVYAIPVASRLGKSISRARIGVVWHTTYSGKSLDTMSASFGKGIVGNLNTVGSIWQDDATYRDVSGRATFTAEETKRVTALISQTGKLFKAVPASLLNAFKDNEELRIRVMAYNNSHIRAGSIPSASAAASGLLDYIYNYYEKEIQTKKTEKSKGVWEQKRKDAMSVFTKHSKKDIENLYSLLAVMTQAKQMIVDKMNEASSIGTFLRTRTGFKTTSQEGYVAIDHPTSSAVKIVDRMEFSRANFSPEILKGWMR